MFLKITHLHTEAVFVCARSLQPCWALCDPVDCSPPGSSVHGILQARTLEQVAVPSSRGIFLTQELNPCLFMSPAFAEGFFTPSATWEDDTEAILLKMMKNYISIFSNEPKPDYGLHNALFSLIYLCIYWYGNTVNITVYKTHNIILYIFLHLVS